MYGPNNAAAVVGKNNSIGPIVTSPTTASPKTNVSRVPETSDGRRRRLTTPNSTQIGRHRSERQAQAKWVHGGVEGLGIGDWGLGIGETAAVALRIITPRTQCGDVALH